MILGRVVGQAVSTHKRPQFEGAKLLLVQPETPDGVAVGTTLLAVDSVGAGVERARAGRDRRPRRRRGARARSSRRSTRRSSASSTTSTRWSRDAGVMDEQQVRALVRQAIARHLGPADAPLAPRRRAPAASRRLARCRAGRRPRALGASRISHAQFHARAPRGRGRVPDRTVGDLQPLRLLPVLRALSRRACRRDALRPRHPPPAVVGARASRGVVRPRPARRPRTPSRATSCWRGSPARTRSSACSPTPSTPRCSTPPARRSRSWPTSPSATTTSTSPACRARGVVVTNTPDVLTNACADFTWALILAVTRRLGEGERVAARRPVGGLGARPHARAWSCAASSSGSSAWAASRRAVAEKAPAFGMTVAYTDAVVGRRRRAPRRCRSTGCSSTSDVVSLHVNLTPATTHLIDQKALAKMRRSAYLVNTARGPVVDEAALAWALRERLIAGAALDVYEKEPVVHPDLLGARERAADSAPGQRHDRDAHGDGRPGGVERAGGARRPARRSRRCPDRAGARRRPTVPRPRIRARTPRRRAGRARAAHAGARDRRHGAAGGREDLASRSRTTRSRC